MNCVIRSLLLEDEPFLWEMLYQALYIPEGQSALPCEVIYLPELACYVEGWGRKDDCDFLASDTVSGQPVGAVWVRLLVGENRGYGYVDNDTPELGIAVFPEYRGQGIGTQLLTHLFTSIYGQSSISLSVSPNNPAVRLYERFGFEVVHRTDESLLMKRVEKQSLEKYMGRADRIQAEFPSDVTMPDELRRLCDYLDRTDYPISGYMKLRPEGEGLKGWFGEGSEAWQQLAGFGAGPDGSTLALWLYAGRDSSNAPVVHLGSEGNSLIVLADNILDFLSLFGIGYGELGFDDLSEPPEQPETAKDLREWLNAEFGIHPPATGIELVKRVQSQHPNFEKWVTEAQRKRDEAKQGGQ